jgi:ABC-2 type transport system permease protein
VINALIIAAAFHIFVLCCAMLTTQIDQSIMIYRDITSMGKIPIDVYKEPLRSFITFIIPVGVMMNFPVSALLGKLQFIYILIAFAISFLLIFSSIQFWNFALRRYTSASS